MRDKTMNRYLSILDEMLLNEPAFGITLARCNVDTGDTFPTMQTDGQTVWFNEEWLHDAKRAEIFWVLMHECCHIKLKHNAIMLRMKLDGMVIDFEKLNIAFDYEVNHFLARHGFDVPEPWLRPFDRVKYPDDDPLWEDIYFQRDQEKDQDENEEPNNQDSGDEESNDDSGSGDNGSEGAESSQDDPNNDSDDGPEGHGGSEGDDGSESGDSDGSGDDPGDSEGGQDDGTGSSEWSDQTAAGDGTVLPSPGDNPDAVEAQIEAENISQAAKMKSCGGASGSFAREKLAELEEPERDWAEIFEEFATEFLPQDFSLREPDPVFMQDGMLVSDLDGEELEKGVILWDISGSMSDEESARIVNALNDVFGKLDSVNVDIVFWSTDLHRHVELDESDFPFEFPTDLGSGGTEMNGAFDYIKREVPDAAFIAAFTDLEFRPITKDPGTPVLWIDFAEYHSRHKWQPTFGEYIKMN